MCRLFGFKGKKETKLSFFLVDASNSLAKQSVKDSRNICNNEGWGLGFYHNGKAYIQKRACCAFFDFNFKLLTDFVETKIMIAHVRDATVGNISDHNAHPFMYKNWIFAHNGTVEGFDQLKPKLLEIIGPSLALDIKGTSDSEFTFYTFISNLKRKVDDITSEDISLEIIEKTLHETLTRIIEMGKELKLKNSHKLNVVMTNGRYLVASKFGNSLYYATRTEALKDQVKLYKDNVNLNLELEGPHGNESVIIASEKLDIEDKWNEIPDGTIISIDDDLKVTEIPLFAAVK